MSRAFGSRLNLMLGPFDLSAVNAVQRAQNAVVSKAVSFLSNCFIRCTNSGTGKTVAAGSTPSKPSASDAVATGSAHAVPLYTKWGSAGVYSNNGFRSPDFGTRTFSEKQVSDAGEVSEGNSGLLKIEDFSMFERVKYNSSGIESPAAKTLKGILATPTESPVDYEEQEATEEPSPAAPKKVVSFANDGKPTAVHT